MRCPVLAGCTTRPCCAEKYAVRRIRVSYDSVRGEMGQIKSAEITPISWCGNYKLPIPLALCRTTRSIHRRRPCGKRLSGLSCPFQLLSAFLADVHGWREMFQSV